MPVVLGYVDVRTGISSSAAKLQTFPLNVTVALPGGDPPLNDLALLATNPLDLGGTPDTDLNVGAMVTRNDASGQTIEVILAVSPTVTDGEVTIWINTSSFTEQADYAARPTFPRGESLLVVGTRFRSTSALPVLRAVLGVSKPSAPLSPRDVSEIRLGGRFDQPRELIVGRIRQRTAAAAFTAGGGLYRRAVGGDFDGMMLNATVHDPTTAEDRWVHVELEEPRAEVGPARPVVAADAGPAPAGQPVPELDPGQGVPTTGLRSYRVAWVHPHGNETAASPPSAPVATASGRIRVALPVWTDPLTPGLLTGTVPVEPVAQRRVYRTATSATGTAGELFLVRTIANADATETIDDRSDEQLGEPELTDLTVKYRHTLDRAGTQLAAGLATLAGALLRSAYEEAADGTSRFRKTLYRAELVSTPPSVDVRFDTRPDAGVPRVTWRSATAAGPAGIGAARIDVTPLGAAAGKETVIRALLHHVPAELGVDWSTWGDTRVRLEVGSAASTALPLPTPLGRFVLRTSLAGEALQRASPRTASIELTPAHTALTVRDLRRLRLLVGHPSPLPLGYARLDDGLFAQASLAPRDDGRPRSFRLLREVAEGAGRSRTMVRAGELPDSVTVDARFGPDLKDLALRVIGAVRRVMVLSQSADELAASSVLHGRRRDGAWITVPEVGDDFAVVRSDAGELFTVTPKALVRADASVRSSAGLGAEGTIHQIQASLATASAVAVRVPESGLPQVNPAGAGGGVSGRVAVSLRPVSPHEPDRLLATRATPQVRLHLREAAGEKVVDDATARVLGLTRFVAVVEGETAELDAELASARANRAFRARASLADARAHPAPWDLLRARVADLPETIDADVDAGAGRYRLRLSRRSGRVVVFAQPPIVPAEGAYAGELVGVGLVKGMVDALPTDLAIDVLGGTNPLRAVPFNATPPTSWRGSGFRIQADGEIVARGVQIIDVSTVRPHALQAVPVLALISPTAFWSNTAASKIQIGPPPGGPTAAPGAVWLWTPGEPPPSSAWAHEWEDLERWLGYRIEAPALVTLQVQAYADTTKAIPRWWNAGFAWTMNAELQMKDYRGEVTIDADLTPEGDEDAGPGLWYLRIPDGAPLGGQVVFGNTGGWISNRPRIFQPFDPSSFG